MQHLFIITGDIINPLSIIPNAESITRTVGKMADLILRKLLEALKYFGSHWNFLHMSSCLFHLQADVS